MPTSRNFPRTEVAFVLLPGGATAVYTSSGLDHYRHSDWLGSARVVTNASGTVQDDSDFYPYGGERVVSSGSGNHYKFTGKERDSESGLDNFGARYDSSQYGRFMSPDPLGGKLVDPQSLNKYTYVLNNPLRLTDPTGMSWDQYEEDSWAWSQPLAWPGTLDKLSGEGRSSSGAASGNNGYCSASMATCGASGTGNAALDAAMGSSPFGFQYIDENGAAYPGLFNSWDEYASWSTGVAAMSSEEDNEINQYNRLNLNVNSPTEFNGNVKLNPWYTGVPKGAHYNWGFTCVSSEDACPTPNMRSENGVHYSDIGLHNDTWSPWTGPFKFSDVFTGNFWKHGLVDFLGGEIGGAFGFVFPF